MIQQMFNCKVVVQLVKIVKQIYNLPNKGDYFAKKYQFLVQSEMHTCATVIIVQIHEHTRAGLYR